MPAFLKTSRLLGAVMALCLTCGAHAATSLPRYGVFIFSSFCVSPMSADLKGDRITLNRSEVGDTLVYEYTDGSTHALVAHDLVLDPKAGTLHFAVDPEGAPTATIAGTIASDGQSMTVHGLPFRGDLRSTLARMKNAAVRPLDCKAQHGG